MVKIMPDKIASAVTYCASGGLVCNGLFNWYDWIYRLDWNFIGLVSGVVLGIATFAVNAYFKHKDRISAEKSRRDEAEQQRIRTAAIVSYLHHSNRHDEGKAPEVVETVNKALKLAEKP